MSRSGYKWNVNECLRLQREYELLQLPISEIARLHKRTPKAIMYKLDEEEIADYNELACKEQVKPISEPKTNPYHVFSKPYYKFCNEKSNKVNQMFPNANFIEKGKIYQLLWSQLDETDKAKYAR
jgi:hypothetical protein